jgi:signal transduction histidine kinase
VTRPSSLRGRLLLGAFLWTVGLFAAAIMISTWVMMRYPRYPLYLHGAASHYGYATTAVIVLCMIAGLIQVRRGLRPFDRLRERLAKVHVGELRRVDGDYPLEVQPVVDDLNSLLDHREQAIQRAQAKAGDLAHGLKTPLAVMAHEIERMESDQRISTAVLGEQVERMRRQIDYHLAHARAAASGATAGARSVVCESLDGIARTLQRLHADRGIAITLAVPGDHTVNAQREDLDEMLGNLLDNSCKWARSSVRVASTADNRHVTITIDDDGHGIEPALREAVLQRGVRADEAAPGSGFGLAIVRDLAEVYGGTIALGMSPSGGVRAQLQLPTAR